MDFVRLLKVFVAVAEAGSFARAAEALRMTRPAVTGAIIALEKAVGARLLQRTTRRTSLTGEGAELLARAGVLLDSVEATRNLFGGSREHPRGRLRIDVAVVLARALVIPALPQFRSRYPEVELILGVSDQPVDLVADAVDCVLRIGTLPEASMIGRTVALAKMVLCASPQYLSEHGTPTDLKSLASHFAVNYFSGKVQRSLAWTLPDAAGEAALQLPSAILANDSESLVGCALAGMGLIQMPGLFIQEHLASGRLVQVLPGLADVEWPISLMYPNRQYLAPQVRAFVDWIAELVMEKPCRWLRAL